MGQDYEDYKSIHYFMEPKMPLKSWITSENYINNFRTDWDSLMTVIAKINATSHVKGRYYCVTIQPAYVQIIVDRMKVKPFSKWGTSANYDLKNALYRSVVEFVTYYNKKH